MRATLLLALLLALLPAFPALDVTDAAGRKLRLARPAARIVSLAPDITENLFAIGAGHAVVGTVDFSDFPAAARGVARVGSSARIDAEAVAALAPDLVIAWESGNVASDLARLRALGLPVHLTQPRRIADIADEIERLGRLTGRNEAARALAQRFRGRLASLLARYAARPPVATFYEVWNRPLMTVGGRQAISDAIRICGGENVFAALAPMAPAVTLEAVLAADPEAIIASGMADERPEWLDEWRRWPRLTATARGNLFFIPPDLLQRHTPRILEGVKRLCEDLETARSRRPRP